MNETLVPQSGAPDLTHWRCGLNLYDDGHDLCHLFFFLQLELRTFQWQFIELRWRAHITC